jgi:hypothetical protein
MRSTPNTKTLYGRKNEMKQKEPLAQNQWLSEHYQSGILDRRLFLDKKAGDFRVQQAEQFDTSRVILLAFDKGIFIKQ